MGEQMPLLCCAAVPSESLVPLPEMVERVDRVLAQSPADSTEISWLEARRGQESNGKRRRDTFEYLGRTILIRVRERGRTGLHRTSACEPSDLEAGIRAALAQARMTPPGPAPAAPEATGDSAPGLYDPELARMSPERAREVVGRLAQKGEQARLGWAEGWMLVRASTGLSRTAKVTSGWIEVTCGRGPGAGRAAATARTWDALSPQAVFSRARSRHAALEVVPPPEGTFPVVLAAEAAAQLLALLNRHALASASFHEQTSPLAGRLGEQILSPKVTLRDDGTAPGGLPFPFDAFGAATRPIDLVSLGVFRTPAVDDKLARAIGLPVTPHLVAPDEALATHVCLLPTLKSHEEILASAEGGLWFCGLDPVECFDPRRLSFRATARGVRRITEGKLGRAVPDLVWEGGLLELFNRVLEVGSEPTSVAMGGGLLGAVTSPALVVDNAAELRLATD